MPSQNPKAIVGGLSVAKNKPNATHRKNAKPEIGAGFALAHTHTHTSEPPSNASNLVPWHFEPNEGKQRSESFLGFTGDGEAFPWYNVCLGKTSEKNFGDFCPGVIVGETGDLRDEIFFCIGLYFEK